MAKHVRTTSDEGFSSTSEVGEFSIDIDPSGENTQDTVETLLLAYAACYMPAIRIAAEQRDVGELGTVEIASTGEVNDNGKLTAIAWDVTVDAEIDQDDASAVIERANSLCKVHDALKPELHASVTLNGHDV